MASNYKEWHVQLLDARTKRPLDDDAGRVYVMTAGTPTYVTLYSDDRGTSQANPITMTNGKVRFFTATSTTSVDLQFITEDAFGGFIEGWAPSDQHINVDKTQRNCTIVAPFGGLTAETSTSVILPAKCAIDPLGVFINVTTIDNGATMDVGFAVAEGGDPDGLLDGVSTAVAGYISSVAAVQGALIEGGAGDSVARYVTDGTIKTVVYTGVSSDTAAGYVVINYLAVP